MKIEDVMALREAKIKEKEATNKELSALVEQLEAVKKRRNKAEKEGDLNAFREAANEYESISFRIRAIRNNNTKFTYSTPEIVSAWNGYAERYNKKFDKKLESFKQKVADLAKDYRELIELQNDAQGKEDSCIDLMENPFAAKKTISKLPREDDCANINCPDTCFFMSYDAFTHDEAVNAQIVLNGGHISSLNSPTSLICI